MLLPYRAKNPPESAPYATIGIIVLNVLVYLATANYANFAWSIRPECVPALAINDEHFSIWRLFSSMFLHENLLHIAGNMLFLWVFGSAVEGRLRSVKFVIVYLLCGIGGDLLHEFVVGMYNPALYSLGASGAIMGIAGC